jgi:hypothetical protein
MKTRFITVFAVLAMLFSAFGVGTASAGAYETEFTTSVTYMNVGTATTTVLDLYFFADEADTTPTMYSLTALAANGAGSLFIGSLDDAIVGDGFQGSAYMQSDQPMLVTLVQIPQGSTTVKNRALSNGFSAGAPTALIATVLKGLYSTNTIFSVQNADSETNTVTIELYDTSAVLQWDTTVDIEPGAAYYVDAAAIPDNELVAGFNGSAVITAERADTSDGAIVANAMELEYNTGVGLKAFEGVASGAALVYMPSALCNVFGGTNTAFAVQNTSLTTATDVTVTYTDDLGAVTDETKTIQPGAKASFVGCDAMGQGRYGSATIESDTTDIIAIGKAYGAGMTTAFLGVSMGYDSVALPYVRYATTDNYNAGNGQRTFITIQNVGAAAITGDIVVQYVGPDGTVQGTHTITTDLAIGAKATSNASLALLDEFGITPTYGGAAIITGPAGSQLAVVARVSSIFGTGFVSEDYNGQPIP